MESNEFKISLNENRMNEIRSIEDGIKIRAAKADGD